MKTCNVCAAINLETDLACGVCGAKLDGSIPMSVGDDVSRGSVDIKKWAGLVLGISLALMGFYLAFSAASSIDTSLDSSGPSTSQDISIVTGILVIVVGISVAMSMSTVFKGLYTPTSLQRASGGSDKYNRQIMDPDQSGYPIGQPAANFSSKQADIAVENKRLEKQKD